MSEIENKQPKFHGIQLYNIELDGCLNGVYTNINIDGVIYNEIAKKSISVTKDEKYDNTDIRGHYDCIYFDCKNERVDCELTIDSLNNASYPNYSDTYHFKWIKNQIIHFEGIGYKMNEKQIVVTYWPAK